MSLGFSFLIGKFKFLTSPDDLAHRSGF